MDALLLLLAASSWLWVPIAFCAYAAGRRRFGLPLLFALLTAEAIALAIFAWLMADSVPER
jgi:hypothetical protein